MKEPTQSACNHSGMSVADNGIIDFYNWHDKSRGRGDESLTRVICLFDGKGAFLYRESFLFRKIHDSGAGNSLQNRLR